MNQHQHNARRRGAVLIETALIFLLLLTVLFGLIEFGHYFYTSHTYESAAQQGARIGIIQANASGDVTAAVDSVMTAAGYNTADYSVTVTMGTNVTVNVQSNWGTVGIRPFGMIPDTNVVRGLVTMRREGP
jgi:Flp pilus assembly protein TadG